MQMEMGMKSGSKNERKGRHRVPVDLGKSKAGTQK